MNFDAIFAIAAWSGFLFIWLPVKHIRHRRRMRSLSAINKGHRFSRKYNAIKYLTGRLHESIPQR